MKLLATHITIAIALTITVGAQSAELARIRSDSATEPAARTLQAALWATPILALLTFITGIAVIADGSRRGPWVSAGVLSTLISGIASVCGYGFDCDEPPWVAPAWSVPVNGEYQP